MLAERETWLAFKRWVLAEIAKLEAEIAHYRVSGFNSAEIRRIEPEITSLRDALAEFGPRAEWAYYVRRHECPLIG